MDLFILEPITDVLAKSVIKDVHEAKGEDINVHIMTLGGSMLAGNAISRTLIDSKSNVTTNVVGVAASMGAVISQAGDKRLIAEDALFNIHNGAQANVGRGTKEEHLEAADTLHKMDDIMVKSLSRSGLEKEQIKGIMSLDKLLTADEAVTLGFFDGMSEPIEATAELKTNEKDMSKLSELMGKVDTAAIKLGLKKTDDEAKQKLVDALEKELKGATEQVIQEVVDGAEGADILSSSMVSREEYELFKAEIIALLSPLLGAVEELPTPEQTTEVVEEKTTEKLDALLKALKSKTVVPSGNQTFEQPDGEAKQDWGVYDAKKEEIAKNTKR